MGAHSIAYKLPKSTFPTKESVEQWYKKEVAEEQHEHGHDAYSGTIATTKGIKFAGMEFGDEDTAYEYILDHTQKWSHVLAVTVTKPVPMWYIGGWAAS